MALTLVDDIDGEDLRRVTWPGVSVWEQHGSSFSSLPSGVYGGAPYSRLEFLGDIQINPIGLTLRVSKLAPHDSVPPLKRRTLSVQLGVCMLKTLLEFCNYVQTPESKFLPKNIRKRTLIPNFRHKWY